MTDAPAPADLAAPGVQANPITIGPFTNVPAPGSPIRSDWPQSISQWVTNMGITIAKFGIANYPTNGNGDAIINFAPAFPTACRAVIVNDATQSIDLALICKVMNTSLTKSAAVVRIYLHDGTKVLSNGGLMLSWLALGD